MNPDPKTTSPTVVTTGPEILFYHSFPRHHKRDSDSSIALKTLRSILKNGLLLTAEPFPVPKGFTEPSFPQIRTCFTATHPAALKKHSKLFGRFSIEFTGDVLRAFGAQPAFYLAAPRNEVALLNYAGAETAFHLVEVYELLGKLWSLRDNPQPTELKEAANKVMAVIWHERHAFQHLYYALEAILNLYYRTDEASSHALRFFEQREWRIIPNFAHGGDWHYRSLEQHEKKELEEINPCFFNAIVAGKPRVDQCHYFQRIANRQIIDEASRIIVPDEFVVKAKAMVADAIAQKELTKEIPVVAISSLPDAPPPELDDTDPLPCH